MNTCVDAGVGMGPRPVGLVHNWRASWVGDGIRIAGSALRNPSTVECTRSRLPEHTAASDREATHLIPPLAERRATCDKRCHASRSWQGLILIELGSAHVRLGSTATSDRSSPMIRSNAASASARSWWKHPRSDPLIATGSQRGVRDPVFEDCFDVDPRRPRGEADQDSPEHQPVGHPWPVAAKRVDWGLGQERLDRRIHGVYNLAFEGAHDGGDLPGRRLWIALGMKTEPTRRPADGHLSARVLSSLLASLTTSRGESVRWLPS